MAYHAVHTLRFPPDYFALGNPPNLRKRYGIPRAHGRTTDPSTPTPLAYEVDARSAIRAVRSVVPTARFVGIAADCGCSPT